MLDLTNWQKKKYQTRDGRPVRLLCIDRKTESDFPLVGLIVFDGGDEFSYSWELDGKCLEHDRSLDLINAKTKKEGWGNVYKNGTGPDDWNDEVVKVRVYASKEEADEKAKASGRLACLKIEWEE